MSPRPPVGIAGRGLTVRVRGREAPVLDRVDVVGAPGRVTGLVGPNGSGKTTLLHTLSGAVTPEIGEVLLGDRPLAGVPRRERARTVAVMEQSGDTDTDLTVGDVVGLARLPHRGRFDPPGPQDEAACTRALGLVGMAGTGRRRWRTLSGGERQRVHAARALAQEPQVLLLDEPTNHLDVQHQHELLALLTGLATTGTAVVVVLHDLALAARYCDRVVVLQAGRVHAAGPAAEALTAATLRDVFGVRADVRHDATGLHVDVLGPAAPR